MSSNPRDTHVSKDTADSRMKEIWKLPVTSKMSPVMTQARNTFKYIIVKTIM